MDRFAVVGHDWGARAAYTLAAIFPHRITTVIALALAYQPRGLFKIPSFDQTRRFWYQWFLCVDGGLANGLVGSRATLGTHDTIHSKKNSRKLKHCLLLPS